MQETSARRLAFGIATVLIALTVLLFFLRDALAAQGRFSRGPLARSFLIQVPGLLPSSMQATPCRKLPYSHMVSEAAENWQLSFKGYILAGLAEIMSNILLAILGLEFLLLACKCNGKCLQHRWIQYAW